MEVKNFTQFVNLLTSTQSVKDHPAFDRLMICMMTYNSLCNNCGSINNQDKTSKYAECNRIYREAIGSVDLVKAKFFQTTNDSTISFYIDDAHLIKTIGR